LDYLGAVVEVLRGNGDEAIARSLERRFTRQDLGKLLAKIRPAAGPAA
jgi:hypothetical protein